MKTAINTVLATATLTSALAISAVPASAQSTLNIGPGPGPGFVGAPPAPIGHSCPAGYQMIIRSDAYGNQTISCIHPRPGRPIPVVGSIIEGIIGGILIGGHRQ